MRTMDFGESEVNGGRGLATLSAEDAVIVEVASESDEEGWGAVDGFRQELDLEIGVVDGVRLRLDLLIPEGVRDPSVVMWIHGGGWRKGSRKCCARTAGLASRGFAVASIDYRLTGQAPFPAQIRDCFMACRWIRQEAEKYGLNGERLGVWGSSAGAHLAALLGLTDESTWGWDLGGAGRAVDAVAGYCGLYDFRQVMADGSGMQPEKDGSIMWMFFGGSPAAHLKEQEWASPVSHVRAGAPPFHLVHGTQDSIVPHAQSERFHDALLAAGVSSHLRLLAGGGHGTGWESWDAVLASELAEFFTTHLGQPCNL